MEKTPAQRQDASSGTAHHESDCPTRRRRVPCSAPGPQTRTVASSPREAAAAVRADRHRLHPAVAGQGVQQGAGVQVSHTRTVASPPREAARRTRSGNHLDMQAMATSSAPAAVNRFGSARERGAGVAEADSPSAHGGGSGPVATNKYYGYRTPPLHSAPPARTSTFLTMVLLPGDRALPGPLTDSTR